MKQNLIALLTGILFGLGLALSQMTDPERVKGFLDIAGAWDPTLIFVLGGAVGVTVVAFRWILRRPAPLLAERFHLPTRRDIDGRLVLGAAIFGVGWAIGGYCPGPGIASLVFGGWNPVLFVAALLTGMWLHERVSDLPSLVQTIRSSIGPAPEPSTVPVRAQSEEAA